MFALLDILELIPFWSLVSSLVISRFVWWWSPTRPQLTECQAMDTVVDMVEDMELMEVSPLDMLVATPAVWLLRP